jgi:hypothetical protein
LQYLNTLFRNLKENKIMRVDETRRIAELPDSISFSRHANPARYSGPDNPLSKKYPSITEKGVKQAHMTVREELIPALETTQLDTVLFILAKSDQTRTGHTADAYGDEFDRIAQSRDDLLVLTKTKLSVQRGNTIRTIKEIIKGNPDKKIIVVYPLCIKQLCYTFEDRWSSDGNKANYFEELLKKYGGDYGASLHDWIETQGKLVTEGGTTIKGPLPEKVAREYLEGIMRVYLFVKKQFQNRPIKVHGVGHQLDLDAVVTFLAAGKVDTVSFIKVTGGTAINESELITDITFSSNGTITVKYRGKEFKRRG